MEGHRPWELVLQRRSYGGAASLIGTELNGPTFSLYANGHIVYYQYINGQRHLVTRRLDSREFFHLYEQRHVLDVAQAEIDSLLAGQHAEVWPVTEFRSGNRVMKVSGLGLVTIPRSAGLERLNAYMDSACGVPGRKFSAKEVTLFVKKTTGDIAKWPAWPVSELDLSEIGRKIVSPYEPNVDENSRMVGGSLAGKAQKALSQASVYEKFSWKGEVYLVGYRPELPR
jgi:hypothetical protein